MASRFSIDAVFKAVDRMSAPINRMGISSKNFSKQFRMHMSSAVRSVERLHYRIISGLGNTLNRYALFISFTDTMSNTLITNVPIA